MMGLKELTARNLSAAIREALNAEIVAKFQPYPPAVQEVPEAVVKAIQEARLLLEIAKQDLEALSQPKR